MPLILIFVTDEASMLVRLLVTNIAFLEETRDVLMNNQTLFVFLTNKVYSPLYALPANRGETEGTDFAFNAHLYHLLDEIFFDGHIDIDFLIELFNLFEEQTLGIIGDLFLFV